ncbi:MAG: T9SS C-terminal target domain-containing protein [Bacteroidetes bacterium]|nr:MAG: T9SS C-terminal target domain-containing protein [Bacteroidota bacterium]
MFAMGDYVYVGGGHDENWSRYDPATASWMGIDNTPEGRVAGTQFSYDGKGYILSGHDAQHRDIPVSDHFMEYDPELDEWTRLPPHPETTRWVPASFVINGYVYMFGGTNRFPPTGTWAKTAFRYPLGEVMVDTDEPEVELTQQLRVYPNPVTEMLTLQFDGLGTKPYQLRVHDALGQELRRQVVTQPTLSLGSLPKGLYFLGLYQQGTKVASTTLIKQ